MELTIYSSTLETCDNYAAALKQAMNRVPSDRVCGVVVHGTSDNVEYHHLLRNVKSAVCASLGRCVPVTLVPQYVLPDGGLTLDIYALESTSDLRILEHDGVCYGKIESENEHLLFIEGIPSSDFSVCVCQQSEEVFSKMDAILSLHGFAVDDIVRQWNYIGNIVSYRDGKQNYQEFNDARTRYYAQGVWSNGYPAATGIGASGEGIIVGCIAYRKEKGDAKAIYPIDNPLQVAAHVYSKAVLIDNALNATKSTPKFERAKLIETRRGACCFVSGTAAIRGEQSVDADSVGEQTIKTIENIDHLVSKENLLRSGCRAYDLHMTKLHVFVKRKEDYEEVRRVVAERYPHATTVYTLADVCRSELLVEIEGIFNAKYK